MPKINEDGTINLTVEAYNILKLNADKLHALEAAGVSKWEGYDDTMDEFAEKNLKEAELNAQVADRPAAQGEKDV